MKVNENAVYQEAYRQELARIEYILKENLDLFVGKYPHVSEHNRYQPQENVLWTSSFFVGMCFLAYEDSHDPVYLKYEKEHLKSFEDRLLKREHISHDLGFEYTLSCVADYLVTGNPEGERIARMAAQMLTERYNAKGKYIQAWGEMGITYPNVKIIIDTMLNLPLLYRTGDETCIEIAKNHAMTASKTLVRKDFSTFHTYLMNPDTGEAVMGKTHQGHRDASTWARGQAWAVYGYALSYRYTREPWFLEVARRTEEVFEQNLPRDLVPYWDFDFTDENPDIRDTSAASIFVCGLLELCEHVEPDQTKKYLKLAEAVMKSLREHYSTRNLPDSNGVLTEGMYHRHDGARECTIWGDYFYMEALMRLTREWRSYW
ncbi:MAG: glycoside hydrolase family 88 protein [Lachnospiraceae bacterium]|nr:glycoside hydrolase family 88 protein [Lachnospiraceae bacterium]